MLYFYYGVMGCSKTANALMTRWQYIDKNKSVWLIKPTVDTRDNTIDKNGNAIAIIKSRVGIQAEAETVSPEADLQVLFLKHTTDVIICDEAQFLTEVQIEQLRNIASNFNIPVLCYGLRTDFKSKLFPGSRRLFELADEIIQLSSVCDCGQPALINARFNLKGEILIAGSQVDIGGDEKYRALCWKCYQKKIKEHM